MPSKAVLFDLDDTLHDKSATLLAVAASQYDAGRLAQRGVPEPDWLSQYLSLNNQRIEKPEVFDRLRRRFDLPQSLAASLLADFDDTLGTQAKPFAGAIELVRSCRARGWKTGLVTNGRDAFQRSKVVGLGLVDDLDAVVTSGQLGIRKPDPRIFETIVAQLGIEPHETAFVGDDPDADMQPALQLGMTAIWKSSTPSSREAFASDSLHQIRAFLANASELPHER